MTVAAGFALLLLNIGLSMSRLAGGLFGAATAVFTLGFLLLVVELLLSFGATILEADAELLLRSGPCELDESESELDELESDSLELPLDDDEPDVEPELVSDVLTD